MSLLSRIANIFRPARLNRELDEELASHLAEAAAQGRDPAEARRAFGSALASVKKAAKSASSRGSIPSAPTPSSDGVSS